MEGWSGGRKGNSWLIVEYSMDFTDFFDGGLFGFLGEIYFC